MEKQSNLTIVILTRNEEEMVAECINSVSDLNANILVIDDNSSDKTVNIAQSMGAQVISYSKKDFADSRNFSLKHINTPYIFYLDADERISKKLSQSIQQAIQNKVEVGIVFRANFFLGKRFPKEEKMPRFFAISNLKEWYGAVHETPRYDGKAIQLEGEIEHYTHKNLTEMLNNTIYWSEIEAKLRLDANHPEVVWWRFPRVMIPTFLHYYIYEKSWQVGIIGLIESLYQTFSIFVTYARLWEMQRK